jgi:hypothetical protein
VRRVLASAAVVALIGGALAPPAATFAAVKPGASAALHTTVAIRRLTESQYRHAIADAFGADIQMNGRFEPGRREGGLLAIGNRDLSITSGGFEQYYAIARAVADQALDDKRRERTLACKPAEPGCAARFVENYGRLLFRRPLTRAEVAARVTIAERAAARADPVEGLKLALVSLLMAPDFLFRMEQAEPDPDRPGQLRLDAWTKASRLSYLLWDTAPDGELLAAAATGALHTPAGIDAQLKRMVASPRLEAGARAFFADMLQLDQLDGLTKDAAAYPKFSAALVDSAREQTLRTLVQHLVQRDGDYRDVFTTRSTMIDRRLAAVYKAPFLAGGAEWTPYSFPDDSERAGVLTEVSFLAAFAHPAASSPTRRGVKVNEIFKCSPTPEPPADVDFSKVQATEKGTVRTRLLDHMTNPGCSACHSRSDPLGLTLEHFDGLGQKRTLENGAPIDVSAELSGKKLDGAPGLGRMLHDDPRVPACLVKQVYAYGVGREPAGDDGAWLKAETQAFADDGYRLRSLLARVAGAPEFFKVVVPEKATPQPPPAQRVAEAAPRSPQGGAR